MSECNSIRELGTQADIVSNYSLPKCKGHCHKQKPEGYLNKKLFSKFYFLCRGTDYNNLKKKDRPTGRYKVIKRWHMLLLRPSDHQPTLFQLIFFKQQNSL